MPDGEDLATIAVECGLRIHKELGPGLFESVYEAVMAPVLTQQGLAAERQKPIPLESDGMAAGETFREGLKRIVDNHDSFAPWRFRVNKSPLIEPPRRTT